jgi:uncharacterized membrane protein (UPF0127 family)
MSTSVAVAQARHAALSMGKHRIEVEVAASEEDRHLGLMYRSSLPADTGMIFVYPADAQMCMWMRNTLIPLSVAFIDSEGRILNIEDMTPLTEDSHCSTKPARYALEMNRGWFRERGLKAGVAVEGLKSLPRGER